MLKCAEAEAVLLHRAEAEAVREHGVVATRGPRGRGSRSSTAVALSRAHPMMTDQASFAGVRIGGVRVLRSVPCFIGASQPSGYSAGGRDVCMCCHGSTWYLYLDRRE